MGSDLIGWEEFTRCVETVGGYLAEQDVVLSLLILQPFS